MSRDFLQILFNFFGKAIQHYHPFLDEKRSDLSKFTTKPRYLHKEPTDFTLDCQICVNTPVTQRETSVRTAHVDDPLELFAGLLYMRDIRDESKGGELEIYRQTGGIDPKTQQAEIEVVGLVPYQPNTLVYFLGTIDSIHGVTPRSKTPYSRRFVNFVSHIQDRLWPSGQGYEEVKVPKLGKYQLEDVNEKENK